MLRKHGYQSASCQQQGISAILVICYQYYCYYYQFLLGLLQHWLDVACCYRWSSVVCQSVCLSWWSALQKQLKWSRCHFEYGLGWAQGTITMFYMGSRSPYVKGQFLGQKGAGPGHVRWSIYSKWLCRGGAAPIWYLCRLGCTTWGHIGITWWIQLNYPCAVAIQPYVNLLWPLVIITFFVVWVLHHL